MSGKNRIDAGVVTRFAIQILFFIFLPALFSSAFSGVKYIVNQISGGKMIGWTPFIAILVVLLLATFLFGRFFCGYACAFGSLGDWLFCLSAFAQKKALGGVLKFPEKAIRILSYAKYLVLVLVVAFCFAGVYAKAAVLDPWEVFGIFRSGYFNIEGRIPMTIVFVLILCGMLLIERFFCMFLCPMGAVFALLPMLPFTTFKRKKEDCIKGCSICEKACPANISLGEDARSTSECFQCGKCAAKCPKGNIRLGVRKLAGTEIRLAIVKAAALFAVCYFRPFGGF